MGVLNFDPPLLNSANPWCTTLEQLKELYLCPFTGAITTRTNTLHGFAHDDKIHQFGFYEIASLDPKESGSEASGLASLNTLGYSPLPLGETLSNVKTIVGGLSGDQVSQKKPIILSITGSTDELESCIEQIISFQLDLPIPLFVEVNLSCPNIQNKPPPAYSKEGLQDYFTVLSKFSSRSTTDGCGAEFLPLRFGIKTPPYSNPMNFAILEEALQPFAQTGGRLPIQFISATNTLGCSFIPSPASTDPHLSSADGSGIGGLAGAALHPLALGNVKLIRRMLDSTEATKVIEVIGIGGVSDRAGFDRMKAAGVVAVGVGTALGIRGVDIFGEILSKKA